MAYRIKTAFKGKSTSLFGDKDKKDKNKDKDKKPPKVSNFHI